MRSNSEIKQRGRVRRRAALAGFATSLALIAMPAGNALATGGVQVGGGSGTVAGDKAKLKANGQAVPPASAPARVKRAIRAGNEIVGSRYAHDGGHSTWNGSGYDCSGTVNYALGRPGARLSNIMGGSGEYVGWGKPGKGEWITTYANGGHMYVMIAGLRLESHGSGDGPSWENRRATRSGYSVRHPRGF